MGKAPSDLVPVIGHVGCKIGPAAVRFANRPIRVVAERGRPEQGLRPGLPVLAGPALGRFEDADMKQIPVLEFGKRLLHRAPNRRARGSEEKTSWEMPSAARSSLISSIIASIAKSRTGGSQSFSARPIHRFASRGQQGFGRLDEVFTRIEAFRRFAGLFPRGFAITVVQGAREEVDLNAGIVDVVLAGNGVPDLGEKGGEHVADERPRGHGLHAADRWDWPRRIRH